MNQSYNYMNQPQTRNTNYSSGAGIWNQRVRPVSSVEEVKASPIDFDGSIFFFPDFANKCIYTKFITIDGSAAINMYELKEMPIAEQNNNFITREEFESALAQIKAMCIPSNPQTPVVSKKEEIISPMQF